jgi:hypothetical protein
MRACPTVTDSGSGTLSRMLFQKGLRYLLEVVVVCCGLDEGGRTRTASSVGVAFFHFF